MTFGIALERCCFGEDVLVVELRRHRRRLRPLAVDEMLTASESRTRLGERNWDSGTAGGLVVATGNARACVGVGAEEVGDVWYSFVPVIDSAEGALTSLDPLPFVRTGVRGPSTLCGSELMVAANCGPDEGA